jgi:hypothetical protein
MTSYLDTTVDAATTDLTGEHGASQAAAEVEAEASELFTRGSAATAWMPAVWKVYAVLALAVGAFLVAVLLMATGLVDAPST